VPADVWDDAYGDESQWDDEAQGAWSEADGDAASTSEPWADDDAADGSIAPWSQGEDDAAALGGAGSAVLEGDDLDDDLVELADAERERRSE